MDIRQRLIFEFVMTESRKRARDQTNSVASSCFFGHADIILLIEKLQQTAEHSVRVVMNSKYTDEIQRAIDAKW